MIIQRLAMEIIRTMDSKPLICHLQRNLNFINGTCIQFLCLAAFFFAIQEIRDLGRLGMKYQLKSR